MQTIGFIGLGHMGNPMVRNLRAANFPVCIYDIDENAMTRLADTGATLCPDLKTLAEQCDIIFTMLQTGDQVEGVCCAEGGVFETAKPETLFVDSSSIDVETSRRLHEIAKDKGFAMIDAPVSGGVKGAEQASLTIMVGGEVSHFEKAKPILEKLGKTIVHAGAPGNGQVAKICNNMILGISMIGISEAFTLGEKLGLTPAKFFEISNNASGQCWAMSHYVPVPDILPDVPASHDYQPGFTSRMMLKDLTLSQNAAESVQAKTPLGKAATDLYADFVKEGHSELDFSGIIRKLQGQ